MSQDQPVSPEREAEKQIVAHLPDDGLILMPVRGLVLFPGMLTPVSVGRPRSLAALDAALASGRPLGLLAQRDPTLDEPGADDLHRIGTVAKIVQAVKGSDGGRHVVVQGVERFRVAEYLSLDPLLTARVEKLPVQAPEGDDASEIEAWAKSLKSQALETLALMPDAPNGLELILRNTKDPAAITDMVTAVLDLEPDERQELLETLDLKERLVKVTEKLSHVTEIMKMSEKIKSRAHDSMDKAQREFYLREQLKAIKKELGEGESADQKELEESIDEAGMPPEVKKEAVKELRRLEGMSAASPESGVIQNYLEWLIHLPWSKSSDDAIELSRAREVLDEDHRGLEKIKKRILEFLAVRKLNPEGRSPILCFTGPPGVGKTSLGRSIARAMGREYVRASLGGVHDEAEIRGHRRTYVGALPGNIIQSLRKAGTNNPVFVLDEIDKLGASFQGDPASALLEVLDPEQNRSFRDNYLGVPFDLSRVMFIATANVLDSIPAPLRDRCEIISLPGYTEDEKLEIARGHLLPRQLEQNGVSEEQAQVSDEALRGVISHYTREAGCRSLEREIGSLIRNAAVKIAEGVTERVDFEADTLPEILGPWKFESEVALRTSVPGVATGLAWTPVGGDILFVEASRVPGRGKLILTGQLGDVMRESAQAAVSLVKAQAAELGIDVDSFSSQDVHIHVPAGAIPKDGPSAGVTMFTALVSLFTDRVVKSDLAMTGEISLRGLVLPVGGIKEKVLAAHRAGIKTVLLPQRNMKDLEEVPEGARAELEFVPVEHVRDLLAHVFPTELAFV